MTYSIGRRRSTSGFALLEVMIAVVVMAFGLLALAALQTSLTRATSQSKARSVGISIAKDQMENLRSFQDMAGYQAIADQSPTAVPGNPIGGVNYTIGWQVDRYALAKATGKFVGGLADTGALNQATYVKDNEFKRIAVTVNWTDAAGASQAVSLEDAIGALNPQDSARLAKLNGGAGARKPIVLIKDPGTEDGVIPIAIGDGSETAATNPKPIVLSRTGEQTVETRFDVLTYSALNDGSGNARAQARVETAVVGCTCTKSAPSPARTGYRPTYWDGVRYAAPERAKLAATSKAKSGATQSPYCDICCQDHNDDGIASSSPKFTPRGDHKHYKPYNATDGWVEAGASDDYVEACRLIRVDGIFDVAADLSDDYFNLLKTVSMEDGPKATETGPVFTAPYTKPNPAQSAEDNYEAFALEYLQKRFVPSSKPATGSESSIYNDSTGATNGVVPASIASNIGGNPARTLDDPTDPVEMDKNDGLKWLHSRGLYIDYLESPALAAVTDARNNCKNPDGTAKTGDALRDCILRVLPFTSINLTELSRWNSSSTSEITVSNNFFSTQPTATVPVRGMVEPGSNPGVGANPTGTATIASSNSGVAVFPYISQVDQTGAKSDQQAFTFTAGGGNQTPGGTFILDINGVSPKLSDWLTGFTYGTHEKTCSAEVIPPRTCGTTLGDSLPATITVRFGGYNTAPAGGATVANPCWAGKTTSMPYRKIYDVTSVSVAKAATSTLTSGIPSPPYSSVSNNNLDEYTDISVTNIEEGDKVTATLGNRAITCPGYTCSGPGSHTPSWTTTYTSVQCPAGFNP